MRGSNAGNPNADDFRHSAGSVNDCAGDGDEAEWSINHNSALNGRSSWDVNLIGKRRYVMSVEN